MKREICFALLLSGCTTGNWSDYNYGPGDWIAENWGWPGDSMYSYEWLANPEIQVHHTEALVEHCGVFGTHGCAIHRKDRCDIYVGTRAKQGVIEHEKRHCRGWTHPEGQVNMWAPKDGH